MQQHDKYIASHRWLAIFDKNGGIFDETI